MRRANCPRYSSACVPFTVVVHNELAQCQSDGYLDHVRRKHSRGGNKATLPQEFSKPLPLAGVSFCRLNSCEWWPKGASTVESPKNSWLECESLGELMALCRMKQAGIMTPEQSTELLMEYGKYSVDLNPEDLEAALGHDINRKTCSFS